MTKIRLSQLVAGASFSLCLAIGSAEATVDHTYVSGRGTDTGGCVTPATACRTFAYAITQTAAAGEIIAIDAANYAPVTISQSISIVADAGGPAGIITPTGNAITIKAGAAVNLRGLTLDGEGTGDSGIVLSANPHASLTISDCFVRHFQNSGIRLGGNLNASILNSVMNDNGIGCQAGPGSDCAGLAVVAVYQLPASITVRNSVANDNAVGFSVLGQIVSFDATVTFADSMAAGNSKYGILINGPSDVSPLGHWLCEQNNRRWPQ